MKNFNKITKKYYY